MYHEEKAPSRDVCNATSLLGLFPTASGADHGRNALGRIEGEKEKDSKNEIEGCNTRFRSFPLIDVHEI
jgi:hypothetical protein